MKKPQGMPDLEAAIAQAMPVTRLQVVPPVEPAAPAKAKKTGSVSVFLRVPADLHASLEREAVERTKATGKGVTVQQIILEKVARDA